MGPNEAAYVELSYEPPDEAPKERLEMEIRVSPSGQILPVGIEFGVQKHLMDQLPEALRKPVKP